MKIAFTQTDLLLKKLYNETGVSENQAIDAVMDCNYSLVEEYHTFEDVKSALATISYSPSRKSVKAILDYSKQMSIAAQN